MFDADYLDRLGKEAFHRALKKKHAKKMRNHQWSEIGRLSGAFPNNTAGYVRREKTPAQVALDPQARFRNLVAYIVSKRRAYKDQLDSHNIAQPTKKWFFLDPKLVGHIVDAATKSEARAEIKKLLGIKTTRGMKVVQYSRSALAA